MSISRLACLWSRFLAVSMVLAATATTTWADVKLPAIFTSHLVLQRDQANPVWGKAGPGELVTVSIGDQKQTATADADGKWRVKLDPLPVGGPHQLTVEGTNKIVLDDVLIGEVWICSGQSNMGMKVSGSKDADLEKLAANFPKIRLISVPQVGTQEPQDDFRGEWKVCTPDTVGNISAVGYFFGRQLHETLNVPIGLIDDAWGGSACEAWIPRQDWPLIRNMRSFSHAGRRPKRRTTSKGKKRNFRSSWPNGRKPLRPPNRLASSLRAARAPTNQLTGNQRPANIYNGVLLPTIGYGIRGAIWYQGESNAGRAYQYRDLFPLMIQVWRDEWKQGDFPFYWVQLADFKPYKTEPGDSDWAELRKAQTMTMSKLPNTGEAVIIDIGEANDIHPRNKQDVGKRLARWRWRDYGVKIPYQSPTYKSMETAGNKIMLTFDQVGGGLRTLDVDNCKASPLPEPTRSSCGPMPN